jgi:hypothetical protein
MAQFTWVTFNMSGKEVARKKILRDTPILKIKMELLEDFSVICWSGEEGNPEISLETYKAGTVGQMLECHSGIALSKNQTLAWLCDIKDNHTICRFK